jgi:CheY-like chemotaxis protein
MQVLLRRMLRDDIVIKLSLSQDHAFALADSAQLENALLNLALNAQDAMPNGGALTLITEEVELDARSLGPSIDVRPGRYVMVCVADEGSGMDRDTLAHVFEPFFTTKEVGKGSGLGLSMVYGFVKQSNGHVTIYSEPGLGTSVRLYLPVAAPTDAARPVAPARSADIPRGGETILVVEDDPFVRSHAITSLESLGYRVMVASDGREALAILRSGARPALLFTDVVMPGGVNGWQLVDQARTLVPDVRVLFTSGYPQEALTGRGQADVQTDLLSKPYRLAELARRVREKLDAPSE